MKDIYICPSCGRKSENDRQCKHARCTVNMKINKLVAQSKYGIDLIGRGRTVSNSYSMLW